VAHGPEGSLERGISPLLVGLLVLLGAAAHVIRVQFLRRRWGRAPHDGTVAAADAEGHGNPLEAGLRALAEQRQLLAGDIARLAEDQARFADEQQQLAESREELAAHQVRLAAAEAELDNQRVELERERRDLEAERLRLEEFAGSAAGRMASAGEDLYAIDDEELPADRTDVLDADPDLAALRSNLADMFGIPVDPPAPPTPHDGIVAATPPAPELSERTAPPGSRESLYQRRSESPASSGGKSGEAEGDSINSYMEALMKRLRQNATGVSGTASSSTAQRPSTEERAPSAPSRPASTAPPVAAAPPANPAANVPDAPRRPTPAPRSKQDKSAVRDTVNSLREVANLSARSAMATYFRRKRTRRGVLVGLSYVALLALAAALLTGVLGGPVSNGAQSWLVLGMGVVVIVHYLWAVCLSDYRRGHRVATKSRREPGEAESREPAQAPASGQPDRGAHRSVAPRRPRANAHEIARSDSSLEPAEDELCAVTAR
jgi:hypothetical protein